MMGYKNCYMKKNASFFAAFALAASLWSCSDNNTQGTDTAGSTGASDTSNMTNANSNSTNNTNGGTTSSQTGTTGARLNAQDSTFVMKAAMGGMMEVQAGQVAQQKAASERVRNFGAMMVNDHTQANQELMSLASSRGMTVPTALPADMQRHMDELQKMSGAAFDRRYMSMMVTDHQKTVADFQKQSQNGNDPDLKAWAAKMLPALQMHRDSAQAISRMR
jgi:putative membrane protein